MKKRFGFMLALILALSLTACGNTGGAPNSENSGAQTPPSNNQAFSGDVTGTVEGQVYNNAFAELTFTAPADWAYLDQSVMDMNVAGGGATVSVSIEPDYGVGLEEHLELVSSGLIQTQAAYEYTRVDGFSQTTIGNNEYTVMEFDAKPFGNAMKQYYVSRAKDGYIIDIMITCADSNSYEEILGCFS